jgi:uncharacterized membrane protein YdjX (TVP38/TMEM64 family)
VLVAALLIFIAWQWSPLRTIDADQLMSWSEPFAYHRAAPLMIVAAYVAASFILFPRPILTLAFVVIFGPWRTAIFGMAGLLLAAAAAFWFGATHGAPQAQKFAGLKVIAAKLQGGGIVSVIVMRMLPVAPFTVVNMFAGALRIRFSNFMIGSFFGLLPGTLTTIVVGDRLLVALQNANWINIALVALLSAAGVITLVLLRRATR